MILGFDFDDLVTFCTSDMLQVVINIKHTYKRCDSRTVFVY